MHTRRSRFRPVVLAMLLLLLAGAGIGSTVAKYLYHQQLEAKVSFTAKLAESFTLLESEAVRDPKKGGYTLNTDKAVAANEYTLMPGVDIPKDPYIQITNKTPIEAYLYVEVVDDNQNLLVEESSTKLLDFTLRSDWKITAAAGPHDGDVYCYTGGGDTALPIDETFTGEKVYLLTGSADAPNGQITVSDTLLGENLAGGLDFYGYLYEVYTVEEDGTARDATAEEVFQHNNTPAAS